MNKLTGPVVVAGIVAVVVLFLAFTVGGTWGTALGLIWIATGPIAFVGVRVFPFPGQSASEALEDALVGLFWGPIALVILPFRIRNVRKERRSTLRHA